MNIFVLTTGRSGSLSFIEACQHITNYSSAHESRSHLIGTDHFDYPMNHIEADNRLTWFLGALEKYFGNQAFYVHLLRDRTATAQSFCRRFDSGIIKAYRESILLGSSNSLDPLAVCQDYYDTVNSNIDTFLKDKIHKLTVRLETIEEDFPIFWKRIHAEGDLRAAMNEWRTPKNVSGSIASPQIGFLRKLKRVVRGLPR